MRLHLRFASAVCAAAVAVSGNAAKTIDLHPIVEVETGYLFGAVAGGKWIKAEAAVKALKSASSYRVYGLAQALGETKGGKPRSIEEPCPDVYSVELAEKPKDGVIAVAADWNALPRKPKVLDNMQPVYVNAVRVFLQSRGIKDPKVVIERIVRVDLEGDSEEEVLVSATNYEKHENGFPTGARPGNYSCVILRRVVAGKVQTQLIAGEFYSKPEGSSAPNYYKLSAVLDLDGDGKLEVVVHSSYYEGGETTIYRCGPRIVPLLHVECGV